MIKQAIAAGGKNNDCTILGVTVLTSMTDADLKEVGVTWTAESAVLELCRLGIDNGVKGIVCSPLEIAAIRRQFGKDVVLVTPGIRPSWAAQEDQKRVFTPKMAIEAGCNYLVVGRPIVRSKNPVEAFQRIMEEIQEAKSPYHS